MDWPDCFVEFDFFLHYEEESGENSPVAQHHMWGFPCHVHFHFGYRGNKQADQTAKKCKSLRSLLRDSYTPAESPRNRWLTICQNSRGENISSFVRQIFNSLDSKCLEFTCMARA